MVQCVGMLLPILAVKRSNFGVFWKRIQAANVNGKTIWIGTRYIKRLDAAVLAEKMFSDTGVEGVGGKTVFV